MSEIAIQLKNRIQAVDIMNNNIAVGRLTLKSMLLALGGLGLLYVLILGNMVFNIVERRALEKEALTLSNEVGDLELSYLAVSNSVDMSLAAKMGYNETKATTFATRKALGSIKLANNEI